MIEQDDVEKALVWLANSAEEYAEARAMAHWLEERRKVVKAVAFKVAKADGKTVGEAEAESYTGAEYAELLDRLKDAIHAEAKLKALREAAVARIEVWRSQQATMRMTNV